MTVTTRRSGRASLAAIAPGSPMPIAAKPLEMMTVFGRRVDRRLATQSLCAPTSEIDHVVGLERRLEIRDDPLGQQRECVVVTPCVLRRPGGRNALRARAVTSGASSSSASRTSATTSITGW